MEYAVLMKKEAKRDDFFVYHPITIIEGKEDRIKGIFKIGKQAFFSAEDLNFGLSELSECYAYTINMEDLCNRYDDNNIENCKDFFLEEIFESMHVGIINNINNKIELHQIPYEQFYDLIQNPILSSYKFGETVTMTKQMLYMLTQNKSPKDLDNTIKKIESGMEKLKKQKEINGTTKIELAPNGELSKIIETNKKSPTIKITPAINPNIRRDIDIAELETFVKERIVGQDECIEDLITIIAENYRTKDRKQIQRPLIIGPTGCGKTETIETIAEYLQIPYTKYSTPSLSAAGYEGKNIDDILKIVYQNSNYNEKRAEESILFLDEIDKIAKRGRDVSDEAVQNLLLTFLDGQEYDVSINQQKHVKINTTLMNIICGGAFSDMLSSKDKILGFTNNTKETPNERYYHATTQDLVNYGFIPEFIGRMPNKLFFKKLTREDKLRILKTSKISPLTLKQQFYMQTYGVDLQYDQTYLDELINISEQLDTGARSLKESVCNSLIKVSHTLQLKENQNIYKKVYVTGETVKNNRVYQLKK